MAQGTFSVSGECEWLSGTRAATPEERLVMAVFHRAILDACLVVEANDRGNRLAVVKPEARRSAESYLFDPGFEPNSPFCLTAVAELLEVDVEYLRFRLRHVVQAGRSEFNRLRRARLFGGGQRASTDVLYDAVTGSSPA